MDTLERALDLLEKAAEAMEPHIVGNGHSRDSYECGGCGRWTYVANPRHPGPCNEFCQGTHEEQQIDHRHDCTYVAITRFLNECKSAAS